MRSESKKLRTGAPEEIQMSNLQDVVLFDGKISAVEEKLLEASAEIRTLRPERRKAEAEE